MKLIKRFAVISVIVAFAIMAGNVNIDNSCGTSIITTFPFSLLVKIFETSGKNAAGNLNKENLSENLSIQAGVAFAQKKIANIKVTFVELGSVNCIPCRMMQPVMKQVEEKYGDQVKVVFYDVWTEKDRPYAYKYNIRAIPTQIFLDSVGKEYYRHIGYFPFEEVEKVLKNGGVR